MGKVLWKYPIEEIHGKLRTDFGAAQRKSKNGNGERDPFTVIYGKRDMTNHPLSSYEVEARARFAAIRALVEEHRCNITKRVADYAGFKAQSTYKTMNKYLWAICTAEYNASLEAGE